MAVRAGHRDELDELEKRMEELRRRFDLYFQGSPEQKTPPTVNQAQVGGELRHMREDEVRNWNTIDRFRFTQLFARFVSMDRLWARTLKQIEDGVYKRDRFKVQQAKKKAAASSETEVGKRPVDLDSFDNMEVDIGAFSDEGLIRSQPPTPAAQAGKPVAPRGVPAPVAGVPPSPAQRPAAAASFASGGEPGISEQRIKQLYDVYMQAKKRSGESSNLTIDQLKKQIEKQVPQIKAKHKCENVDFKVVLKDGKAMLKAVPK